MSPVGGVGINLAIQDAVAAANVLWKPLSDGSVGVEHLAEVQRRRERPVRIIQAMQTFVQTRLLAPALRAQRAPSIPWIVRVILSIPVVRDIPPRMIALGIDRPHVESPARNRA
jgi:2-polyprenyl-6-methoxyphenol hydroxylase-like FAD-dependent oxidoreductase